MKLSKKRVGLYSSVITAVLVVSLIAIFMQNSGIGPHSNFVFAAGTPDALGNRIYMVQILQYTGGTWNTAGQIVYTIYVPSYTLTIASNVPTIVQVYVYLNYSLAGDSTAAKSNTRVYLTVSGVYTSAAMIAYSASSIITHWSVLFSYPSVSPYGTYWTPATDVTYTVTFAYQAYY